MYPLRSLKSGDAMTEPQKTAEKPAETATPPKRSRWKKGLLIGAFALAVGGLAYDNLSLRVENYILGNAVVELYQENQALKEIITGGEGPDTDSMPVIPRDQNRIIQVSTKAPARPSI